MNPRWRANAAIGSTPRTWRTLPSNESSPTTRLFSRQSRESWLLATRMPRAMGRS